MKNMATISMVLFSICVYTHAESNTSKEVFSLDEWIDSSYIYKSNIVLSNRDIQDFYHSADKYSCVKLDRSNIQELRYNIDLPIEINGGSIERLFLYQNELTLNNGDIKYLFNPHGRAITITGGVVSELVSTNGNIIITGGAINRLELRCSKVSDKYEGKIYLEGGDIDEIIIYNSLILNFCVVHNLEESENLQGSLVSGVWINGIPFSIRIINQTEDKEKIPMIYECSNRDRETPPVAFPSLNQDSLNVIEKGKALSLKPAISPIAHDLNPNLSSSVDPNRKYINYSPHQESQFTTKNNEPNYPKIKNDLRQEYELQLMKARTEMIIRLWKRESQKCDEQKNAVAYNFWTCVFITAIVHIILGLCIWSAVVEFQASNKLRRIKEHVSKKKEENEEQKVIEQYEITVKANELSIKTSRQAMVFLVLCLALYFLFLKYVLQITVLTS